jgi:hypothetical protein
MRKAPKTPLTIDQIFVLLDEFYKRGFTKKEMKEVIDVWWKVSTALESIRP